MKTIFDTLKLELNGAIKEYHIVRMWSKYEESTPDEHGWLKPETAYEKDYEFGKDGRLKFMVFGDVITAPNGLHQFSRVTNETFYISFSVEDFEELRGWFENINKAKSKKEASLSGEVISGSTPGILTLYQIIPVSFEDGIVTVSPTYYEESKKEE